MSGKMNMPPVYEVGLFSQGKYYFFCSYYYQSSSIILKFDFSYISINFLKMIFKAEFGFFTLNSSCLESSKNPSIFIDHCLDISTNHILICWSEYMSCTNIGLLYSYLGIIRLISDTNRSFIGKRSFLDFSFSKYLITILEFFGYTSLEVMGIIILTLKWIEIARFE